MKHVIIGAGVAGVTAAETIRVRDADAEIVLIGEERFFPYERYLLTEFLNDTVEKEHIFFRSADFFRDNNITLRKGEVVKSIHPERKTIKFFHNEVMSYDKLLIAVGGRPTLGTLRPFAENIQNYYQLEDILVLKQKLESIDTCVVAGHGLSALDLMRGLRNLGKHVIYIAKGQKLKIPFVADELDEGLEEFLAGKGVELVMNDQIVEIQKEDEKFRVCTLDKKEFVVDVVFAWDAYRPNLNVIAGTAIEKKAGILVDPHLLTSEEDIYAAGDCVEIYHPGTKDYWVNFGRPNACEQGEIAGANMAGDAKEYKVKDVITFNLFGKALKARWWE